ncbi:MAG: DUF2332 domain-containing protein [Planctomycetota bacterium]
MADRTAIAAAFDRQQRLCADFDAPIYAELCRRGAEDVRRGGAIADLVTGFDGDPAAQALPLRVLAAAHARVLDGTAPHLAMHFPTAGGTPRWPDAFDALLDVLRDPATGVREWLGHPPQTNEVGRSAALLGGFVCAAATADLPLHLRELGASAGLNLRWDRYAYELGPARWGATGARPLLRPMWTGPPPPLATPAVASRRGCDLRPLDPRDDAVRRRLEAFVWPDHPERMDTLRAALDAARGDDLQIERSDAGEWLDAQLQCGWRGGALVVFHSSVWHYLPPSTRQRIERSLGAAGATASAAAPLHWLRWEDLPGSSLHELRLQSWPGGDDRLLAIGQPHGRWIEWLAADAPPQPITR